MTSRVGYRDLGKTMPRKRNSGDKARSRKDDDNPVSRKGNIARDIQAGEAKSEVVGIQIFDTESRNTVSKNEIQVLRLSLLTPTGMRVANVDVHGEAIKQSRIGRITPAIGRRERPEDVVEVEFTVVQRGTAEVTITTKGPTLIKKTIEVNVE